MIECLEFHMLVCLCLCVANLCKAFFKYMSNLKVGR